MTLTIVAIAAFFFGAALGYRLGRLVKDPLEPEADHESEKFYGGTD